MIDKDNIETKEFSIELPEAIEKLQAIASLTMYNQDEELTTVLHGLGFIIQEVCDDLRQIYNALYPETKIFCPEE